MDLAGGTKLIHTGTYSLAAKVHVGFVPGMTGLLSRCGNELMQMLAFTNPWFKGGYRALVCEIEEKLKMSGVLLSKKR